MRWLIAASLFVATAAHAGGLGSMFEDAGRTTTTGVQDVKKNTKELFTKKKKSDPPPAKPDKKAPTK